MHRVLNLIFTQQDTILRQNNFNDFTGAFLGIFNTLYWES